MINIRFWIIIMATVLVTGCASMPQSYTQEDRGPTLGTSENRRAAEVNTELGVGYFKRGYIELAVEKLERALKFDSTYGPAHHAYALVQEQLGQSDVALRHFERAVSLNPRSPEVQNNFGVFLCSQKQYDRAQKAFRDALAVPLYRTPEFAYTNSGLCYQQQGDYAAAVTAFQRALEVRPTYGPAMLELARSYFQLGDAQSAAEAMKRYEDHHRHSADSLKLAIQIDEAVGDREALASHELILRGRFPDSPEARWLEERRGQ